MKLEPGRNNIYFISDVHLLFEEDEKEKQKREKLYDFFEYVKKKGDLLVIAGDLFDFWYEWKHVIPMYWFPVIHKMRNLIESGVKIAFVTGNHDFEWGDYFSKSVGIHCFSETMELEAGGKKFFIAHGDGFAKKDRGYRFLKKLTRNRVSKFLFKTFVHPDLGMHISKWASHSSRKIVNIDKQAWSEEYFEYAKSKFSGGFDYVIMGHLHTPLRREDGKNVYINTGDWIDHFSYGYYDGKYLTLNFWPD